MMLLLDVFRSSAMLFYLGYNIAPGKISNRDTTFIHALAIKIMKRYLREGVGTKQGHTNMVCSTNCRVLFFKRTT